MDPQDLIHNNQDPSGNDQELSIEELEDAAGGGIAGPEIPSDSNENGCHGGNCNC